jgi:hypothetical protein
MSLPAEIAEVPDRLSRIALDLRGSVRAIRGERPSEAVMNETAQLVLIIAAIGAESARLRALCAASKDTGAMERPVMPPKELELHPRNLPLQVDEARLLESLHRAGDHTLDPDEERSTDGQA